jgi:hypothetical protein
MSNGDNKKSKGYETKEKVISTNDEIKRYNTSNLAEFVQTSPDGNNDEREYGTIKGHK